ncbi:differentiation specific element binding protein, putative [Trichomonas vaginalis G3]|uniref:Differentiation specific element binding protein, putative n=1 Tax=Trichomonas vaginalis (strain ATCC PRA-98 / G3) TaxID=412133 RepID=A2G4Z2_TRIV3|nr:chromosome transmission fidelity factor 18 family [Trichomonas vaginalis G3]EAX87775.1 differentiation specific element binding protein, putative [Trichomonas vaginalis G3]KAI5486966.1 chromosome transmission fidelity factor 18 family [Trichomonas vaginalis G3]|eukprot:XP_001300705.1 differentiation specific element binding protein [Trichomonas vaginalis G3]
MPPRKAVEKKELPNFPKAVSNYTLNQGFRFGMSDNPPNLGQVPIPIGKSGCLEGITFVATGTMPSITRETLKDIIEKYGGRLTTSISGKTDVVIRGCIEVGPSKLAQARERGLLIIDEESLFQYLQSTNPNYVPPPPPKISGGPALPESMFPISSILTEKYRPRQLSDIVSNYGALKHLVDFFEAYDPYEKPKCAILCGPPGIGKSTAATLVALYCDYHPIELNASDTRSKKSLNETFPDIFDNKAIDAKSGQDQICLIFDEVDGMSAGDRGGLQELTKFVDRAINPVICICNDRENRKLETLAKRSVDIKFATPTEQEVASRLRFICEQEGMKVSDESLLRIAQSSNGDFRHAINTLQFWVPTESDLETDNVNRSAKVIPIVDVVEATTKLFRPKTDFEIRFDCYFVDYGMVPLYMHENLPINDNAGYADALESMAIGDVLNNDIYQNMEFQTLPAHGFFSAVAPSILSPGKDWGGMAKFPMYFGKNSRHKKLERYINEMGRRISRTTNLPTSEINDTTVPLLLMRAKNYLSGRKPNIDGFLDMLDSFEMTLDDYEHLGELYTYGPPAMAAKSLPGTPAVKGAVTRGYRQRHTNASDVVGKVREVREDYMISERPKPSELRAAAPTKSKKQKRKSSTIKTKRVNKDGEELIDDDEGILDESENDEEEDEDIWAAAKNKSNAKSTRRYNSKSTGKDDEGLEFNSASDDAEEDGDWKENKKSKKDDDDDEEKPKAKRSRKTKTKNNEEKPKSKRGRKPKKDDDEKPKTKKTKSTKPKRGRKSKEDEDDEPNSEDEAFVASDSSESEAEAQMTSESDEEMEFDDDDESSDSPDEELNLSDDDDEKEKKAKREAKKNAPPKFKSKLLKKVKGRKTGRKV